MRTDVFVFNPFAEGYIARGAAFTPVKHQAMLARDLAHLPQFLCGPRDVVVVPHRPSPEFLASIGRAGFPPPEFVEVGEGGGFPEEQWRGRDFGSLRPWAWGPDSVKLLAPLFGRVSGEPRTAERAFNEPIARLYSKAWSAGFLRRVLAHWERLGEERGIGAGGPGEVVAGPCLCNELEAGVAVDNVDAAWEAIAAIRRRGHHRVVVKEALGLAGSNAVRLWEPEILPAQRRWLARAIEEGLQLVVEPWLEREMDFSVQLEMGQGGVELRGYTGLVNDCRGQFLGNWAEPEYFRRAPARVAALLGPGAGVSLRIERFYDEVFTLLEAELRQAGYVGPVSIDALVYRTARGDRRLKPVVEINPRYTMGRLTVELMKRAAAGSRGRFRLASLGRIREEGFADFIGYADALGERSPLRLDAGSAGGIREGVLCLNDPREAGACLATFEVDPD
jgi:hypothetical protein